MDYLGFAIGLVPLLFAFFFGTKANQSLAKFQRSWLAKCSGLQEHEVVDAVEADGFVWQVRAIRMVLTRKWSGSEIACSARAAVIHGVLCAASCGFSIYLWSAP